MVALVAKDDLTHHGLATQFRERTVRKTYLAVVRGVVGLDSDLISAPIGNHRRLPMRMSVRFDVGRPSGRCDRDHQRQGHPCHGGSAPSSES